MKIGDKGYCLSCRKAGLSVPGVYSFDPYLAKIGKFILRCACERCEAFEHRAYED